MSHSLWTKVEEVGISFGSNVITVSIHLNSLKMAFAVSKQASYIVLYCVLSFFTFLAILSIPHVSKKVPEFIRSRLLIYGVKKVNDESTRRDYFLSARKAVGTAAVALSYFAASMGSWVLYVVSMSIASLIRSFILPKQLFVFFRLFLITVMEAQSSELTLRFLGLV